MIDFIGIGAQKTGTSWVYACLFEHPEICSPVKEIHFFSRSRYIKGKEWYENHFASCEPEKKKGEFSTSYLYSPEAAGKIAALYPNVRLIAILREPTARSYSQYRNAIKAGEIPESVPFSEYFEKEESCKGQSLYTSQVKRYYSFFDREQLLVLFYEDIQENPLNFIQRIYRHIGIDDTFVPPSLGTHINVARTPKHVLIDLQMHKVAEWLRRHGASRWVHTIRRSGATELIRKFNSKKDDKCDFDLSLYRKYFEKDITRLSYVLQCDMKLKWKYEND